MAAVTAVCAIWRSNHSTGPVKDDGDVLGAPPVQRRRLSHKPEIGEAIAEELDAVCC